MVARCRFTFSLYDDAYSSGRYRLRAEEEGRFLAVIVLRPVVVDLSVELCINTIYTGSLDVVGLVHQRPVRRRRGPC